jgi:hypothetical protein
MASSSRASRAAKNLVYKKMGKHQAMRTAPKKSYSSKAARAGKDIGKPGKNFAKIAAKAGKKYGSVAAGKRVAGAVLAKLRKAQ